MGTPLHGKPVPPRVVRKRPAVVATLRGKDGTPARPPTVYELLECLVPPRRRERTDDTPEKGA